MKTETSWLSEIHAAEKELYVIACELNQLGRAFGLTDNSHMQKLLCTLAEVIAAQKETISRCVSEKINDDCKRSKENLNQVVSLAFAVLTPHNTIH